MEGSWLKLYRKLTEWEWYTDSHMVHLFLHLLIKANSSDKNWRGITVKKGQLITNLNALSVQTGISKQSVRTCLNRLEKTGEINTQTNTRFTVITICKFDSYQDNGKTINTQTNTHINTPLTHDQHTANTPSTHTKEYKNIRKITVSKETAIESQNAGRLVEIKKFFNSTLDKNNSAMPRIKSNIEGQRKAMLNARISEYGIDTVRHVIFLASQSDFLNGGGGKGFVANFEWIMRPNNFPKILDGNFNNKNYGSENNITGSQAISQRNEKWNSYAEVLRGFQEENERSRIDKEVRRPEPVSSDI